MSGEPTQLGPFKKGLNNAAGVGEYIEDDELFNIVNLEVDIDGSLANRPAIKKLPLTGISGELTVIGTYRDVGGRNFLCVRNATQMAMFDASTGGISSTLVSIQSVCAIQWLDKLWVIPTNGSGGSWSFSGTSWTWLEIPAIPIGESVTIYKQRMIVVTGVSSPVNASRLWISNQDNPALWNWTANPWVDVEPGNGEKLACVIGMANDVLLFKEHSTYRFGWSNTPEQFELSKISNTIGVPNFACAATYDNNNIYLMHGDMIYELFNYSFTDISSKVKLSQITDFTLRATETYGLTIFRDRLFIRYYSDLYVYNIKTQAWARWISDRKFSRLYVIPSSSVGLDFAFSHPANSGAGAAVYFFQDDRVSGVGDTGNTGEQFDCEIVTKTYDYDAPYKFKVQFWWEVLIATSGQSYFSVNIPNSKQLNTWDEWNALYTWDELALNEVWGDAGTTIHDDTVDPSLGAYGRKSIRVPRKCRFRQAFYTIRTAAVKNVTADSSVRIYQLVTFMAAKEIVPQKVS